MLQNNIRVSPKVLAVTHWPITFFLIEISKRNFFYALQTPGGHRKKYSVKSMLELILISLEFYPDISSRLEVETSAWTYQNLAHTADIVIGCNYVLPNKCCPIWTETVSDAGPEHHTIIIQWVCMANSTKSLKIGKTHNI